MDNTSRIPAGVDAAAYSRMQHKFEKPHWLYTESALRVASAASVTFAALLCGRVASLLYFGVSILTPLTAVGAALLVVSIVAWRHLRICTNDIAAKRQAALDYMKKNPNEFDSIEKHMSARPGLTYSEVAEVEFYYHDLGEFAARNGLPALKYLPAHCNIFSALGRYVDRAREKESSVTAAHFDSYINYICAGRPDLKRADLERCVQERLAQPLPPSLASAPAPVAVAAAAAAATSAAPFPTGLASAPAAAVAAASATVTSAAPSSQLSPEEIARKKAVIFQRLQGIFDELRKDGIVAVLQHADVQGLGIQFSEVAPLLANDELETHGFEEFVNRNSHEALRYATNGTFIQRRFIKYVEQRCSKHPSTTSEFFRSDIDGLCKSPANFCRRFINRKDLEQEVSSICARVAEAGGI